MALVLNEEQTMLRESAAGFLSENASVALHRQLRDEDVELGYSEVIWKQMVEMGWPAILIDENYGGLGFGAVGMSQVMEQLGRNLTAGPLLSSAVLAADLIARLGSEAQKQALLPAIASGDKKVALAIDETAHHGLNRTAFTATSDADGYRLQGRKTQVIDGLGADHYLVVARTSGEANDHGGLSLFLVDAQANGLSASKVHLVDSRNYADLVFDGVTLPGDALVGDLDQAYDAVVATLDLGNLMLSAELLGIASECFDRTLHYLKERKQFGQLIGSFQALQHRAAHLWSEIELCKSLLLRATQAQDKGSDHAGRLASAVKAKLCEVAELATNEAIQMHGGIGMTDEFDIGFFIKRARPAQALLGGQNHHLARFASLNGY